MGGIRFKNALYFDGEGVKRGDFSVYEGKITFKDVPVEREIDSEKYIFLPGFVNAHHHTYSSLAKGVQFDKVVRNFYENLKFFWWRWDASLDEESIYYSGLVAAIESLKKGVTLIFDHHASFSYIDNSLSVLKRAFETAGIRSVVCFEVSDRLGPLNAKKSVDENMRFIKTKENDLIKGTVGMHASFTVGDKTMGLLKEVVEETRRPIHVHVAEDRFDRDYSISIFGKTPVERLRDWNLLFNGLLAHVIWVDDRDINLIKEYGAKVLHNPESNMNNAVGYLNLEKIFKTEIPLLLGTDGFSHSVLTQLRSAILNAKSRGVDGWDIFKKSLLKSNYELGTRFFGRKFGKIEEGYVADIIGYKYPSFTPISSDNLPAHLFFGLVEREVDFAMVGGKILIEDGKFVLIDENEINMKAHEVSRKLWKRFENNKVEFRLPDG